MLFCHFSDYCGKRSSWIVQLDYLSVKIIWRRHIELQMTLNDVIFSKMTSNIFPYIYAIKNFILLPYYWYHTNYYWQPNNKIARFQNGNIYYKTAHCKAMVYQHCTSPNCKKHASINLKMTKVCSGKHHVLDILANIIKKVYMFNYLNMFITPHFRKGY